MPLQTAPAIRGEAVAQGLAALGVRAGDVLMLHGALSSLGWVEGGAPAVIEALLGLLGPQGTLAVPTLTDITRPFSVEGSPSTVGQLTEVVRRWPGAVRSRHPTHAVAAVGGRAPELTAGHEHTLSCAADSPYGRVAAWGGWVLLLGVDQDRNTTWHVAETIADVPYLCTLSVRIEEPGGNVREVSLPKWPRGHREFIGLDRPLRQAGLLRAGRVGPAVARLMPAGEMVAWGVARLRQDPAAFLCGKPTCVFCQWARAILRGNAGDVDWADRSHHWGCRNPDCEVCVV
jgi:aminoglycoside 3-N-acetyltransferase